jgi:N-acetylglucosamine kinase-like BadF-type ATPase
MPTYEADARVIGRTLVAGVDGGGTSTRALIVSADGTICGIGRAGPSNPHQVGAEGAAQAVRTACEAAWADAGINREPLAAAFLGLAGAGSFVPLDALHANLAWLVRREGAHVTIDHDLRTAHAGALAGAPGIVVIAGTGSSGYGRNDSGQTWRAGGGGWVLDDVGSGFWLAIQALQSVLYAHDGRGQRTALDTPVLQFLGLCGVAELPGVVNKLVTDRFRVAALAPIVLEVAARGDVVAQEIVQRGACKLARIATAIGDRLFAGQSAEVTLAGGLSQVAEYRAEFAKALNKFAPRFQLVSAKFSPLVGAGILALESAGFTPTEAWLKAVCAAERRVSA